MVESGGFSNDFGNDIFISKLDSSGDFLWAKSIGNDSSDLLSQSIAIDPSGNIYLTGFYMGTVDLDPDSIRTFSISSTGVVYDVFISKFDNSGNFIWVKEIDGINNDYSYSLAVDGSEHVYVAGYFYSPSLVFGPINLANSDNTGNTLDIFIAKLDTALNTNINEIKNNGAIVFPNPANSQFTITLRNRHKKINIIITDISGKVILTNILTETQRIEIMTKDFIEGIYIVRIQDEDFLEVKKIIIEK